MNSMESNMKNHPLFRISFLLLSALLLLTGCGSTSGGDSATPTASPSDSEHILIVEGRIVPRDFSYLYTAAGKVEEIPVSEGQTVAKGAVLLRLGDRDAQEANLAAAQADLKLAEEASARVQRTALPEYHQAILDEAAAQKAYNAALKIRDAFDSDQYDRDLDQAESDVVTALSELKDAQKEYDKYAERDKNNADRTRTKDALEFAQTKYDNALIRQTEIENRYHQAISNLETARGRLAEAARIRKQRESGPDEDRLAQVQANLSAAQARVAAAQAALDHLDVVAPYDGVIARIDISAGEYALPSQPVIVFADLSEWFVETTDLTETEIVDVQTGQRATIVPDALPDLELGGTIERVGLTYVEKAGDVVYPVRIRLDPAEADLFWGMTVEVRIEKE
jgi:HlyD family secretion protein